MIEVSIDSFHSIDIDVNGCETVIHFNGQGSESDRITLATTDAAYLAEELIKKFLMKGMKKDEDNQTESA